MSEGSGVAQKGEKPWYASAWKQIVFAVHLDDWHPDIFRDFDARAWVEAAASTGAQLVKPSAKDHAGIAYYVTELEHTHMGLEGRDAFGEMLELLHQRGIRVVTQYSAIYDNYLFKKHPDWRIRDIEGRDSKQIPVSPANGRRCPIVCSNSPYRDLLRAQLGAFGRKYDVDGLFMDMIRFWIPICYCQYCREKYGREASTELPTKVDRRSPEYRHYARWRDDSMYDFILYAIEEFKSARPEASVTFNGTRPLNSSHWGSSLRTVELADYVSGDPVNLDPSTNSLSLACSIWDSMTPNKAACLNIGRFNSSEAEHVGIKPRELLAATAFTGWAHGCSVQFIDVPNTDGTLYGSVYKAIKDVFDQARPVEQFFGGQKIHSLAVYLSEDTRDYWAEAHSVDLASWYLSGIRGTHGVFQQEHIPVDVITRLNLDELDQYSLVCVPDMLCMRQEEVVGMRSYVERGGCLLVTRLTSLANEWGDRSHNFALADVMGVDYLGETQNKETYIVVAPELCRQAGIPDDMELKLEVQTIVKARPGTEVLGHIVLPATNRETDGERWVGIWGTPPQIRTPYPAIVMNSYGKGRCCYVSGRLGAELTWNLLEVGPNRFVEHQQLTAALGRTLLGENIPLEVKAPWSIIATGYRQPEHGRIVVHLVNFQPKVPFIPVRDISVTMRLANGETVAGVVAQPDNQALPFNQGDGVVSFTVPEVRVYQAIVINLDA